MKITSEKYEQQSNCEEFFSNLMDNWCLKSADVIFKVTVHPQIKSYLTFFLRHNTKEDHFQNVFYHLTDI